MKVKFTTLIFQGGVLDETIEHVNEFRDITDLARTLVSHAAMQSALNLDPLVRPIWSECRQFPLPKARKGYGAETHVVIKSIEYLAVF